jgi:hypothetical protein
MNFVVQPKFGPAHSCTVKALDGRRGRLSVTVLPCPNGSFVKWSVYCRWGGPHTNKDLDNYMLCGLFETSGVECFNAFLEHVSYGIARFTSKFGECDLRTVRYSSMSDTECFASLVVLMQQIAVGAMSDISTIVICHSVKIENNYNASRSMNRFVRLDTFEHAVMASSSDNTEAVNDPAAVVNDPGVTVLPPVDSSKVVAGTRASVLPSIDYPLLMHGLANDSMVPSDGSAALLTDVQTPAGVLGQKRKRKKIAPGRKVDLSGVGNPYVLGNPYVVGNPYVLGNPSVVGSGVVTDLSLPVLPSIYVPPLMHGCVDGSVSLPIGSTLPFMGTRKRMRTTEKTIHDYIDYNNYSIGSRGRGNSCSIQLMDRVHRLEHALSTLHQYQTQAQTGFVGSSTDCFQSPGISPGHSPMLHPPQDQPSLYKPSLQPIPVSAASYSAAVQSSAPPPSSIVNSGEASGVGLPVEDQGLDVAYSPDSTAEVGGVDEDDGESDFSGSWSPMGRDRMAGVGLGTTLVPALPFTQPYL